MKKVYISKKLRRKEARRAERKIEKAMKATMSAVVSNRVSSLNVTVGGESQMHESPTTQAPRKMLTQGFSDQKVNSFKPDRKTDRFAIEHKGIYLKHKKLQNMNSVA